MPNPTRRDYIAAQNRSEELLLELIYERVSSQAQPPSEQEYAADDERMTKLGHPPSEGDLGFRKGYRAAVEDTLECLLNAIMAHNEGNDFRL